MSVWILRVLVFLLSFACFQVKSAAFDIFFLETIPDSQLTILDVLQDDDKFQTLAQTHVEIKPQQKHWFKIAPNFSEQVDKYHWVLHTDRLTQGHITFYWVQSGKLVSKSVYSRLNNSSPEQRIFPHIRLTSENKNTTIYIELSNPIAQQISLNLTTAEEFDTLKQSRQFWYGAELSLLYFVGLFMFVMALTSKYKYLAYLGGYFTFIALQYSVITGVVYFYLPDLVAEYIASLSAGWLFLSTAACIMFNAKFLSLKYSNKSVYRVVQTTARFFLAAACFVVIFQTSVSVSAQVVSFIILLLCIGSSYYHAIAHKRPLIKLMLLAWLPALLIEVGRITLVSGFIAQSELVWPVRILVFSHVILICLAIYLLDKKKQDSFAFYSLHDKDTGLANRQALHHFLEALVVSKKNHTILAFSPMMSDQVKLSFGVEYANKRLKVLFKKLKSQLSQYLEIGFNEQTHELYKLSDDTFALVLVGDLSLNQIEQYVCLLAGVFEEGVEYKGFQLSDQIKAGVAHFPTHAINSELLIQRSLLALADNQSYGANWHIYDPSIAAMAERRLKLSAALQHAIQNNELSLFLQPQVVLCTGQVYGAEGLLRWQHPDLGFITPDEFIPIAEASGQINALTEWVITQGLNYQQEIIKVYPNHMLSLNISGKDLSRKELIVQLITQLNELALDPSQIILEITESVAIAGEGQLKDTIEDYRHLGVKIAIDDYGTGYSSLAYLSELGFDELKVDKQFVMDIDTSSKNQTICKTTCDMAKSLGSIVVAEGVESLSSYNKLMNYGCDIGQGYFISKPIRFDDYMHWLTQANQAIDVKQFLVR
ncbi:EAL domain-containing protein [Pseudoalteromonas phenolica]|uniref:EAL domain-containing protein n=1 Tax=Pseudoalteromonas phenolica TaxID=161398 RepID=UPI00110ABFC7|nr:EAL domain-containing protein [Pseudoalteromonas phenolica]TMO57082.1 diguanylate cyclase [Pseudoalteromonas phenolica]